MKYGELKRSLSAAVEPVYIIYGNDDFLRNYAVGLIRDKCISVPDINYMSFEGVALDEERSAIALNSLRSYPFLSDRRMVLIKEYYPSADEIKRNGIGEYLKAPEPTSVFIISNKKECKALDKAENAVKVDCNADMALCVGWICNEAKKAGLVISPAVAGKISEYCLLDFTKINGEVSKLVDYCSDSGVIDMSAVDEIVHKDSEYRIYEMVEAIISGRNDQAYGILTDLLGKNESEQKIFIAVYSHFRRMLHVAVSDASNVALAEVLGVKEYAIKMTKQQLRRFSVKKIKNICESFSRYDAMFKSGELGQNDALWNGVFTTIAGVL